MSYTSGPVLSDVLNEFGQRYKNLGLSGILTPFYKIQNNNKFNNACVRHRSYIYQMPRTTLNHVLAYTYLRVCHYTRRCLDHIS